MLRKIFGPKKDEMTSESRKLHNEELGDLCSSPIIFRVIKSRRIGWVVALTWRRREGILWRNFTERYHLGDPGIYGRKIIRWICRKWDVEVWTGSSRFRIGTGDEGL